MLNSWWIRGIFAAVLVAALMALPSRAGAKKESEIPARWTDATLASGQSEESVVFAGGCFWGVQAVFQHVKGVISATSGYSGGEAKTAEYRTVSTGSTGHAESVKVVYDPSQAT